MRLDWGHGIVTDDQLCSLYTCSRDVMSALFAALTGDNSELPWLSYSQICTNAGGH